MKLRFFWIGIVTVVVAVCLIGFALGWSITIPRNFNKPIPQEKLHLPRASQFVPINADLAFHLTINPNDLPVYLDGSSTSQGKKALRRNLKSFIQDAFSLLGIDFESEISDSISSPLSFFILDSFFSHETGGWVLALTAKDSETANLILQRFWENRSFFSNELEVTNYKGIDLISGPSESLANLPFRFATTLVQDNLVLIGSDKYILERSLDSSQRVDENQLGNSNLEETLTQRDNGIAFLTASPKTLDTVFGFPKLFVGRNDLKGLICSFGVQDKELNLEASLQLETPIEPFDSYDSDISLFLNQFGGPADLIAFLHSPSQLFDLTDQNPTSQLLRPFFEKLLTEEKGFVPKVIFNASLGPFMWIIHPQGWLIGSKSETINFPSLERFFAANLFNKFAFESDKENFRVWSKPVVNEQKKYQELVAEIGSLLFFDDGYSWLSNTFSSFQRKKEVGAIPARLNKLERLIGDKKNLFSDMIFMNVDLTKKTLDSWRPWILIRALNSGLLNFEMKDLALAVGLAQNHENTDLILHAILQLA